MYLKSSETAPAEKPGELESGWSRDNYQSYVSINYLSILCHNSSLIISKMVGNFGQDVPGLLTYFMTFVFSFLFIKFLKKTNVLWTDTLMGRNEFDWSIFSGWFTGKTKSK